MRIFKHILPCLLVVTLVAACSQDGGRDGRVNKQQGGAVLGAAAGALAGSQIGDGRGRIAATAIGTFLGAMAGSEVGRSLDKADMTYHNQTAQKAFETARTGTAIDWQNPDTGASGSITPTRTFQQETGNYCREYQQTITVGGQSQEAYGTACRQPDGSWQVTN